MLRVVKRFFCCRWEFVIMGSTEREREKLTIMEEMNDDIDYHSWYAQKKVTYTRERMCHCRDFKVKKEVTFVKNLKL